MRYRVLDSHSSIFCRVDLDMILQLLDLLFSRLGEREVDLARSRLGDREVDLARSRKKKQH